MDFISYELYATARTKMRASLLNSNWSPARRAAVGYCPMQVLCPGQNAMTCLISNPFHGLLRLRPDWFRLAARLPLANTTARNIPPQRLHTAHKQSPEECTDQRNSSGDDKRQT